MNRRKLHISPRLQLGIALVLIIGCLVAATGVAFARYRVQQTGDITFTPDKNAKVYLGVVQNNTFTQQAQGWETAENKMTLSFAVSNGTSDADYAAADQLVRVWLVASLGAWSADSDNTLTLTVNDQTYTATAERIAEGSALHKEFGEGWIFRFLDEAGEELTWPLAGGDLAYIPMTMEFSQAITDTSLLQLQVTAENQ